MVVLHASFMNQKGKTGYLPKIWEPLTHGGRHVAFLLRKINVDAG